MKHNGNGNHYSDLSEQHYTNLYPSYFDGATGVRIARYGGIQASGLGTYLLANRFASPLGLYYLPLPAIRLPLTIPEIVRAFEALDRAAFAEYDYGTGFVWVKEMARIRMQLISRNDCLAPKDSRVTLVNRLYRALPEQPFSWPFFVRYRKQLRIEAGRKSALIRSNFPLSPLDGPFDGPRNGPLDGPSTASTTKILVRTTS